MVVEAELDVGVSVEQVRHLNKLCPHTHSFALIPQFEP